MFIFQAENMKIEDDVDQREVTAHTLQLCYFKKGDYLAEFWVDRQILCLHRRSLEEASHITTAAPELVLMEKAEINFLLLKSLTY